MSRATKRKHVTREVVENEVELTADQKIVKVLCGRGNNLHEVSSPDGSHFLASMPSKFRKNVWIKRGDYVVIEPIKEGHKVQAEIVHILYPMQIKTLKEQGLWPQEFIESSSAPPTATTTATATEEQKGAARMGTPDSSSSVDDDDDLFQNTNHPAPLDIATDDSSSESEND